MEQKKKGRKWIIVLALVLILGGIAGGFYYQSQKSQGKDRLARDEDALGGLLPGKSPSEMAELLSQKVEEGMVDIGIAAEPVFEEGGKKGKLGIENVPGNRYSLQIDLVLDDTGETIYQSGLIDPGYYIEYVELNKTLKSGEYHATAVFTTYSLDETEDEIAKTKVNVLLRVKDGKVYS